MQIGTVDTRYGKGELVCRKYGNGALALVIEPHIATVSINLAHGQPCMQSEDLPGGHFYVDTNNLTQDLLDAVKASGHVEETDLPHGVSGYCTYPVWRLLSAAKASTQPSE